VSYLLDVNLLLASVWRSHAQHAKASAWLDRIRSEGREAASSAEASEGL
jgi:predicted nucleic acid-binding protein